MKILIFGSFFSLLGLVGQLSAQGADPNPVRLQYQLTRVQGAVIPVFTGWQAQQVQSLPGTQTVTMYPRTSQNAGFAVSILLAPSGSQMMRNFPVERNRYVQKALSQMQKLGQPRNIRHSYGSQVVIVDQDVRNQEMVFTVRTLFAMKRNGVIILMAFCTAEGYRKYGQSLDILLAKTSFPGRAAPNDPRAMQNQGGKINPALVGRWVYEFVTGGGPHLELGMASSTKITVTIYANGTYTYHAVTATSETPPAVTQEQGTVVQQGGQLVFTPSRGRSWKVEFRLTGGGIWVGGKLYIRQ